MNSEFIIFLTLVTLTQQRPQTLGKDATILKYENVLGEDGEYKFSFESSDGTTREESAILDRSLDGPGELIVQGSFSYISDNGVRYSVNYIADRGGYRVIAAPKATLTPDIGTKQVSYSAPASFEGTTGVKPRIDASLLGSLIGGGVG